MFKAVVSRCVESKMSGDMPAYLRPLENQLTLSNIGFGTMFTNATQQAATSNTPASSTPAPAPAPVAAPMKKLRFMLVGTHIQQFTGYSKVTYNMMLELAKQPWLELVHFGFQRHPAVPDTFRTYPAGVDVIDAAAMEKPPQQGFGFQQLPDVIRRKEPDVVLIYNDMSIVARFLEEIRKSGIPRTFKIWVYIDQVYNTQMQMFLDILNRDADRVFAFTNYWKKCIKDQGITRPLDIILHGFDSKRFFPIPRELVRKNMGLPQDAFLIMSLNRNQPRKRYDILVMAFVELVVKYPTKPIFMLCICDKGEKGGWWIFELFQRELKLRGVNVEQFGNRLMLSSSDMTFKDEDINMFYNAADVGISTADGEGFGLCNFEQMGVGVPQVVPDIGGFKEFCKPENTVLVKPKYKYYLPSAFSPVGGEAWACDPHDVCLGLEEYVLNTDKKDAHGKAAREHIMSYTWDRAMAPLVKCLKRELEDKEDS
jgi:glycosyltransferase involved in cell wall biosynthesis